jgi:hypothetical protein
MDTNKLMEMAEKVNGRARNRTIGKDEAQILIDTVAAAPETAHTIRVYSRQGFVANSYKYRAEIRYFQAVRHEGEWIYSAATCDAKRSHGQGALVTINGRAA